MEGKLILALRDVSELQYGPISANKVYKVVDIEYELDDNRAPTNEIKFIKIVVDNGEAWWHFPRIFKFLKEKL